MGSLLDMLKLRHLGHIQVEKSIGVHWSKNMSSFLKADT